MNRSYLYQQMTHTYKMSLNASQGTLYQGGTFEDSARNYRNRNLTNAQMLTKVKEAIQMERARKSIEQDRSDENITLDWNKFLNTKLVTKPC